ncbi:hypothetical protein C1H46_017528 [Malus baccata]|uniref:Secreted protein n=1 Tax=Malus baccata TaxID=106549 RepID=A0A540MDG8_MALBA|nr:hypothetical protein C1H46_017528 [Malus baccata]
MSLSLLFSLNAQLAVRWTPPPPCGFPMKIRQFLVRLDESRITDHFFFNLRFKFEHGKLESASIS